MTSHPRHSAQSAPTARQPIDYDCYRRRAHQARSLAIGAAVSGVLRRLLGRAAPTERDARTLTG